MKTMNYILTIIIIATKLINMVTVSKNIECDKKVKNLLSFLAFPFPIITSIICCIKYKKDNKSVRNILINLFVVLVVPVIVSSTFNNSNSNQDTHYDMKGNAYKGLYDVVYYDKTGNKYKYDFDKSGYDKLYINSTDKYYDADLCYLDTDGYLCYDDDMSIVVKNENECVDTDSKIYYPVSTTTFNKDKTINHKMNSSNFSYDRFGNAYTYDNVPYFDKNGDKYAFSFDSNELKGYFTNLKTKEVFDSENSYVDKDGYFVYDKSNSIVKNESNNGKTTYIDSSNNVYYKANSVYWNKEGKLDDNIVLR